MADISDVTKYLRDVAVSAVYPNGVLQPSVASMDTLIYEGWPVGDALDLDLAGKMKGTGSALVARPGGPRAHVSIYPMLGQGNEVYQIQDETYTITPAVHGMAVSVAGTLITVGGQPTQGEYLTLVCDGTVVFSQTGASTAAILVALAAQALPTYPGTVATATTLNVPVGHSLTVRQGAVATLGRVTHRQRHQVRITAWAPNQETRTALAKAIDVEVKRHIRVTLPDTSQVIICYSRTDVLDDQQASNLYRRDLIYDATYATLETFPGYEITSVDVTIASAAGNAQAHAIT